MRLSRIIVAAIALCVMSTVSAMAQERHALVIGINDYDNLGSLQKAVNDGQAMAESLERAGFTVDAGYDLSRRDFVQLLARYLDRLQPDDEALVFYAGHAVAIENSNFLVPSDASALEQSSEALIMAESIGQDFLLNQITATGVRLTVVIMDACRNNPFEGLSTRSVGREAGLAISQPPRGVFMLYSADEGQTALDRLSNDDPHPNSVFTRTLLPLIEEPGLDIVDIARRLRGDVQALAAGVQHQQFPVYRDRMQGDGRFIVRPATVVVEQPVVPAPAPVSTASPCIAARADWALLGDTPSAFLLEAFIQAHPNCALLVAMATEHLAAAQGTPVAASTEWELNFSLDIPEGESLVNVLPSPCFPDSLHECVIWGMSEDTSGREHAVAWLGEADGVAGISPGDFIPLTGDTDFLPVEITAIPNAYYNEIGYILRGTFDFYAANLNFGPAETSTLRPVETFPDFALNRESFGHIDMAYRRQDNVFAIAYFGTVQLMRPSANVPALLRGLAPNSADLLSVCGLQADGAVPWNTLQISDDGTLLVGRHAAWTVVMELPEVLPQAPVQERADRCETLGARVSSIHYAPFQDMSSDGRFLAVTDYSDTTTTGPNGYYTSDVVSIYTPRGMLNSDSARPSGTPVPLDRVETEYGGVANLYDHGGNVTQATFSLSGDTLISITEYGVLRLWAIPSGALLATHETINGARIERADFAGQGNCVLVDLSSGPSVFIDPASGEVLHTFRQPSTRYAYDLEGQQVVVYSPGAQPARVYSPPAHTCMTP